MAIDRASTRFPKRLSNLRRTARLVRRNLLRRHLVTQGESIGEKLSPLDMLVYLGLHWLTRRDRLIVSTGHGSVDFIGLLCDAGLKLSRERVLLSAPGHALESSRLLAKSLRAKYGNRSRVACLLSAMEISTEAVRNAAYRAASDRLTNLFVFIDVPQLPPELGGEDETASIAARWQALGFMALVVDGHNLADIHAAMSCSTERPICLVAKTSIGRDIAFAGNLPSWHYAPLRPEQYALVMSGLEDRES